MPTHDWWVTAMNSQAKAIQLTADFDAAPAEDGARPLSAWTTK